MDHEQFQALSPNAPLPWKISAGSCVRIIDANGLQVCQMAGGWNEALTMASMILIAVNTCGGFAAVPGPVERGREDG
jgi:hypothetical protein